MICLAAAGGGNASEMDLGGEFAGALVNRAISTNLQVRLGL
jgi:hypothetical protein